LAQDENLEHGLVTKARGGNPPERIDHRQEHRADLCPDCGGPLNRCSETRTRFVEDIPEIKPVVTVEMSI
jgi:transposase